MAALSSESSQLRDALLVSAAELATSLSSVAPPIVIELASPTELEQDSRRIPSSQRVWRPDYQQPMDQTSGLDGIVPTRGAFQSFVRSLGIDTASEVVLVDRKYDATRLWWLFCYFGKTTGVRLLDGGFASWLAAGQPVTDDTPPALPHGTWVAQEPDARMLATRRDVLELSAESAPRLWDVRSIQEHDGTTQLRGAAKPGRIPWTSARVDWGLFRREDGGWESAARVVELAEASLGTKPKDTHIHTFYCQSGVRTTQLIFGMTMAGWQLSQLRNYDGSWVEWSHIADESEMCVAGLAER
jgi:thiosulfate/3-mercaptopyruvate sulfurtransferase